MKKRELTIAEAAIKMDLTRGEVRALCKKNGGLPDAYQLEGNKHWRIPVDNIENWIAKNRFGQSNKKPDAPTIWKQFTSRPFIFWPSLILTGIFGLIMAVSTIIPAIPAGKDALVAIGYITQTPTLTPSPTATITPTPSPAPTELPFPPATNGETLIVVVPFWRGENVTEMGAGEEIYEQLDESIKELDLDVRVEIDRNSSFRSFEKDIAIQQLDEQYNASLIIWGEILGGKTEVNFFNFRQPAFEFANLQIEETDVSQRSLAQQNAPDPYSQFIYFELPSKITFLTFFALGQAESSQNHYLVAINLIEEGINSLGKWQADSTSIGLESAFYRLGWLAHATGQYEKSVDYYDEVIYLNPQNAFAYQNRGFDYLLQGKHEQAISDFEKALELDTENAIHYYSNLGNTYFQMSDFEQAADNFKKALDIDSGFAIAHYNLGKVYEMLGSFEEAITSYESAIFHNEELAIAYDSLGTIYARLEMHEEAISSYQSAINLQFLDSYNHLGVAYHKMGRYDDAIESYHYAISADGEIAKRGYYNRGLTYAELGDYRNAVDDYTAAILLNKQYAMAYLARGSAHLQLEEYDLVVGDFEKYLELDPDTSERFLLEGIINGIRSSEQD